jgi:hypothetical protein
MAGRHRRVVRELHGRWRGDRSTTDTEASLASQIRVLEDRVVRLRRLGAQYAHIRVSRYVEDLRAAEVA